MLKLIKRMLPVLVCAVIFVMSGALGAECSAEEDYGYFGALEDHQDALSGEQAQELLDILDSTAREIHANVGVILGNASLDGLSERSYAKEFTTAASASTAIPSCSCWCRREAERSIRYTAPTAPTTCTNPG